MPPGGASRQATRLATVVASKVAPDRQAPLRVADSTAIHVLVLGLPSRIQYPFTDRLQTQSHRDVVVVGQYSARS